MNKQLIAIVVLAVGLIGGGVILSASGDDDTTTTANNETSTTSSGSQSPSSTSSATPASSASEQAAGSNDTAETSRYITLAEFDANPSAYDDKNKVLFFHADWCPQCRSVENEILSDTSQVPEDTVIIKTDYDSETALRQEYGVTNQTTFVQIDNDRSEIAQWFAPTLSRVIDGIQL